ncbi:LysE family translocator [Asanoa iriomotensis]|uniref:Lysine transporter LysE n=1 Tax=Asanoa iriomotensis TaxID=234613 RepID=A0ABQ4C3N0_9ACTN|nr:LysE family translocator [Asanoa iriomotensis]GIF57379.1 lysine transporter LysE [Asanoa iriomotensis]
MAAQTIVAFWAVALLLIVVPGPDWAFTLSVGGSGRSVVPAVGGLTIGYGMLTGAVALGVGATVAASPAVLTALTVVGGCYLMWHGATTAIRRSSAPAADTAVRGNVLLRGIGVSALNPKGLLLFVALLPQFADRHGSWPVAGQLALLGLVFTATCTVFYLGVGSVARTALRGRPATARLVVRISGAAMFVVGAALLVERIA